MHVRVRLFAMLRQRAGRDVLELELPDSATVGDALDAVGDLAAGLPLVLAVNREYAPRSQRLAAGDELALIPPVSGGSAEATPSARVHVALRDAPLSFDDLVARVRDPRAGAVVTFSGVTREVERLDYEAYAEMAEPVMREIVEAAMARHGLCAAAAEHRVGSVPLSEPSVLVAVSAPHRPEAFLGAREIIDELKARAPIWKAEVEGERSAWVQGTPPPV
jgi:MoaE-MoaD fusion protein